MWYFDDTGTDYLSKYPPNSGCTGPESCPPAYSWNSVVESTSKYYGSRQLLLLPWPRKHRRIHHIRQQCEQHSNELLLETGQAGTELVSVAFYFMFSVYSSVHVPHFSIYFIRSIFYRIFHLLVLTPMYFSSSRYRSRYFRAQSGKDYKWRIGSHRMEVRRVYLVSQDHAVAEHIVRFHLLPFVLRKINKKSPSPHQPSAWPVLRWSHSACNMGGQLTRTRILRSPTYQAKCPTSYHWNRHGSHTKPHGTCPKLAPDLLTLLFQSVSRPQSDPPPIIVMKAGRTRRTIRFLRLYDPRLCPTHLPNWHCPSNPSLAWHSKCLHWL